MVYDQQTSIIINSTFFYLNISMVFMKRLHHLNFVGLLRLGLGAISGPVAAGHGRPAGGAARRRPGRGALRGSLGDAGAAAGEKVRVALGFVSFRRWALGGFGVLERLGFVGCCFAFLVWVLWIPRIFLN